MWLQFEPIRRAQVLDGAFTRGDWCSEETKTAYCLRSSTSLAVRPAISPMERRMSSLSLGSSHRSAMRLASASSARMISSPSGPPWGSASQAWKNIQIFLSTSRALHRFLESQREQKRPGWDKEQGRCTVPFTLVNTDSHVVVILSDLSRVQPPGNGLLGIN